MCKKNLKTTYINCETEGVLNIKFIHFLSDYPDSQFISIVTFSTSDISKKKLSHTF